MQALLEGGVAAPGRRRGRLAPAPDAEPSPALEAVAEAGTRTVREGETDEVWRCQATEALKASEHLRTFKDPGQYWREFRNGNFGRLRFIGLMARALVMEVGAPPRPAQAAAASRPGAEGAADRAAGPAARRARSGASAGGDRGDTRRPGLQPRPLVRPRDAPLLRADAARQGPRRPADRRDDRPHAADPQGLHHPRGLRLLGGVQHRSLVLPARDLSVLARGLARAGSRSPAARRARRQRCASNGVGRAASGCDAVDARSWAQEAPQGARRQRRSCGVARGPAATASA